MDGIAQLALTLAVGTVASFAVFKLSVLLYERVKSPLLNPLLVTVAFIIAALVALRIPLDSYEQSVQLISFQMCIRDRNIAIAHRPLLSKKPSTRSTSAIVSM